MNNRNGSSLVVGCIRKILGILAAITPFLMPPRIALGQDATPTIHALLIGCGKYDSNSIKSLNGPDNDVAMTAQTLSAPPYLIPKSRLRMLSCTVAANARPTRENILREFESLRQSVQHGDQVVLLMAGHGTRVANDNPETDWEPDGLDEVLLPIDASLKTATEGGIRDDTIGDLLDDLQERGAFVFLLVDTCFSGTMARGPFDDERKIAARAVDASSNTIPVSELASSDNDPMLNRETPKLGKVTSGNLAILYAGPSGEEIKEQSMPPGSKFGGTWHGRLSWKFNKVLNSSAVPLTYRELEQQIRWEFAKEKWTPMPWLSGTSPDRTFLGVTEYPDRSRITLAKANEGKFTIDAGILHNMHEESVLDVTPLAGSEGGNKSLPRIRVTESHPLFSYVEKMTGEAGSLFVPARCTLVERGIPEHRLKITIAKEEEGFDRQADQEHYEALASVLKTVVERNEALLAPAGIDAADLILVHRGGKYFLETPDRLLASASSLHQPRLGPFELNATHDSKYANKLECQLTSAARASLLRKLAITDAESTENGGFKTRIELQRQRVGEDAWSNMSSSGETLKKGDIVSVQVTNIDTRVFDVNMLYIDSAFEIASFFPSKKQVMTNRWDTRLEPGQKTPPVRFEISTENIGLDDLLILLTSSTGGNGSHFLDLEQSGINDCSTDPAMAKRNIANNTRLGSLLQELLFSTTDRRSIPLSNLRELAVRRLSWYVRGEAAVEAP